MFTEKEPNRSSFPVNNSCHGGTRGGHLMGANRGSSQGAITYAEERARVEESGTKL